MNLETKKVAVRLLCKILLALLMQLLTKNNSKKFKDDINQILKELYHSKQITKQVYNILNKSILHKNDL